MRFFYKLSNDALPTYFVSYTTLIQPLTTHLTTHLENQYMKHSKSGMSMLGFV